MPKDYVTVVVQLPDDPAQREKILGQFQVGGDFHGGRVTAMSTEDEITVVELMEARLDSVDVDEVRAEAKSVAARAEAAA